MSNTSLPLLLHLALATMSAGAASGIVPTATSEGSLLHRLPFALLQWPSKHGRAPVRNSKRIAGRASRMRDGREHLVLGVVIVRATMLRRPVAIGLKRATEVRARSGWGTERHRRAGGA